jgi:hypothetical protein
LLHGQVGFDQNPSAQNDILVTHRLPSDVFHPSGQQTASPVQTAFWRDLHSNPAEVDGGDSHDDRIDEMRVFGLEQF